MKLATLKAGGRDGTLVVVSRDLAQARRVPEIAHSLQQALDDWAAMAPKLAVVAKLLEEGAASDSFPFEPVECAAPCPGCCRLAHPRERIPPGAAGRNRDASRNSA